MMADRCVGLRTSAPERYASTSEREGAHAPAKTEGARLMALPSTTSIRPYRIYLRDAENLLAQGHDAELASDDDARELAMRMLNERTAYPCAEVWDRARLVC